MVGEGQVFLVDAGDRSEYAFEVFLQPFLDDSFRASLQKVSEGKGVRRREMAYLAPNAKVRLVLERDFERTTVVLNKVVIHSRLSAWPIWVFHRRLRVNLLNAYPFT